MFAYENCSAWIASGLIELFGIANIALENARGASQTSAFVLHVLGRKPRIASSHGMTFATRRLARRYDAAIMPALWAGSHTALEGVACPSASFADQHSASRGRRSVEGSGHPG